VIPKQPEPASGICKAVCRPPKRYARPTSQPKAVSKCWFRLSYCRRESFEPPTPTVSSCDKGVSRCFVA
jgi:hypothetical protein